MPFSIHGSKFVTAASGCGIRWSRNALLCLAVDTQQIRCSTSSSNRWQNRQGRDRFVREANVQGLKSRAAFKLLEINEKYKIFKKGQTVVDLGYAPGSWSQVAVDRTSPDGRVLGIDIIPAQPPKGVSTIQGNFLSPDVQAEVKNFLSNQARGRPRQQKAFTAREDDEALTEQELGEAELGYIDLKRRADMDSSSQTGTEVAGGRVTKKEKKEKTEIEGRSVDVVLSDMSAPWEQTTGFWKRSLSDPYYRMMNTSGTSFRDHAGSMVSVDLPAAGIIVYILIRVKDLCLAALQFCFDTLRTGGKFVCKFYQGAEDKSFELQLRKLFHLVYRVKPDSSRSVTQPISRQ
ncbi:MAG: 2' O-ribose methyltransferase [Pleopsidium flavum]|nr:MAG: 2' O-ribose methyltransferase [Pleopsidium flavum]